jgi:hypothetical protein
MGCDQRFHKGWSEDYCLRAWIEGEDISSSPVIASIHRSALE